MQVITPNSRISRKAVKSKINFKFAGTIYTRCAWTGSPKLIHQKRASYSLLHASFQTTGMRFFADLIFQNNIKSGSYALTSACRRLQRSLN